MIQSRMYAVVIMTSQAGTRPLSSARRTRRWEMTALSVAASCKRICFCSGGGKTDSLAARRHAQRSEEHTSELQSHLNLVCRLLLEKKNNNHMTPWLPRIR